MTYMQTTAYQADLAAQRSFLVKVYGWMTAGLMITAIVAQLVAWTPGLTKALFGHGMAPFIILMIAQFAIAVGLGAAINKIPVALASALFVAYAVLTGVCFAIYFLLFTQASIVAAFGATALTFGGMSVFGYVTKMDLSKFGGFLIMGVWGLIVASVINMFWANSTLYWATTYIGVLIFIGLTAYDTQKIKYMYMAGNPGSATQQKAAIIGAFELYLDFVIIFQYLIRILGDRR